MKRFGFYQPNEGEVLPQSRRNGEHNTYEWESKFLTDPHCHYCRKRLTLKTAQKEHQTPLCRGGVDKIDNIVPACSRCNQMKAWRTKEEFMKIREGLSNRRKEIRSISNPKSCTSLEEQVNEPQLLKKLVLERETLSWAWKNPA